MRKLNNLKLPNGYGSITKLPGKRRKPWWVRITEGWGYINTETGEVAKRLQPLPPLEFAKKYKLQQRRYSIGTFETYQEAFAALVKYNDSPYESMNESLTFEEVCDRCMELFEKKAADGTYRIYLNLIKRIPPDFLRMKMRAVKASDIESMIRSLDPAPTTAKGLVTVLRRVFDYAVKHDVCEKNYADLVDYAMLSSKKRKEHPAKVVAIEDVERILSAKDDPKADMLKIALFTGMRLGELITIKGVMVNLEEGYITHGSKTDAGKNRIIPLHRNIRPVIARLIKEHGDGILLRDTDGRPFSRNTFRRNVFDVLLPGYTPHHTRHTFITQWRSVLKLDPDIQHLIVGHKKCDVSEDVYTHRSLEDLQQEMEKFYYIKPGIAVFRVS